MVDLLFKKKTPKISLFALRGLFVLKHGSTGRCHPLELSLSAYMTFTHVKEECARNYPALRDVSLLRGASQICPCSQEHLLSPGAWEFSISAVTLAQMLGFSCWGSGSQCSALWGCCSPTSWDPFNLQSCKCLKRIIPVFLLSPFHHYPKSPNI